jgi:hydroxyacylglutathione hydrolase
MEAYALALVQAMILRPFLHEDTACASYLFGCLSRSQLAVVDPHVDLVDRYLEGAERAGAPIAAVFETHVQADHVSGLPALVEATGATPYLPGDTGVEFPHTPLADGQVVELGNTLVRALATPGHAPAHHSYVVADRRRGTEEPWLVFTGDSLLVGDVGRPDLHAGGEAERRARELFRSITRLLELPDHILVYPSHFGGSVCGRALSGNPFSSIGFERSHNQALAHTDEGAFARALLADPPPPPADQTAIVAANRRGLSPTQA